MPDAYLAGDRRRAIAEGRELADRVRGAALFADISGFTPLTEALATELGPQRGAEELTAALDSVFGPLLSELDRYGGDVIFFSGDAVTAWIDGDDGRLAVACALAMQQVMADVAVRRTPTGREFRLGLKVAVVVGAARRFVVGDPEIQLIDVLAGAILDRLADAEHEARQGDVVMGPDVFASVGELAQWADPAADRVHPVATGLAGPIELPAPRNPPPHLPDDVVRRWVLPRVYDRIRSGQGDFLAELRPGAPLFMRFGGIDFDHDPDAPKRLDELVTHAQRIVDAHGGSIIQLTIGDKGAYLYAIFGAPIAHEDDVARACATALELRRTTEAADVAIGVTAGGLRCGTYGHPERHTFGCQGDAVNLAARLMAAAPAGAIYVSADARRAAGAAFEWGESRPLEVKGKRIGVIASSLVGYRHAQQAPTIATPSPLVGRDREIGLLRELATQAVDGSGQIVVLTGPAGVGKTRLLAEIGTWLADRGVRVRSSAPRSYGVRSSYAVWQDICRDAWTIAADATTSDVVARLESVLAGIDPGLLDRLPLLGPLVGALIPDTALTASFDAKLRKTSLESLMVTVLADSTARGPLAYLVDAAEHMDELSWDLFDALRRDLASSRLLVVMSRRPDAGRDLTGLPHLHELTLDPLDTAARRQLIAYRLGGTVDATVPPELVDRLDEVAGGNPFHVEELTNHIVERGLDLGSAATADIGLPTTLQSLQLARFDELPEEPRRTLMVASVVGVRFSTASVAGSYPELGGVDEVDAHAVALVDAALVVPERDEIAEFAFRNVVTQQAAYGTMPFAWRATLHDRVLGWLEPNAPGGPDANLDVLAFHAGRGTDDSKKREYIVRAGVAAQARYANEAAVAYFGEALPLVNTAERPALHRRLGKVLEILGRWAEAEASYMAAVSICEQLGDTRGRAYAQTDLAEVARKQAKYDEATRLLDVAGTTFSSLSDQDGLAGVLHLQGTIASQQANYDDARTAYAASLAIRRELDDQPKIGALLSNLAVVAEQIGDYVAARDLNEQALAVRERVGDPWAIAVSQNNLGMIALLQEDFEEAAEHIGEAARLADKVGDRWIVAVAEHNNGNALRGLHRYPEAGRAFLEAMGQYVRYDDRWSLALLVEDVLLLAAAGGQAGAARELLAVADLLRAELEVPRPPAVAETLAAALDDAAAEPGALPSTSTSDIVELIERVCAPA